MNDNEPKQTELVSLLWSYEERDWCRSLGCTAEQVHEAVATVGNSADRVQEYLVSRGIDATAASARSDPASLESMQGQADREDAATVRPIPHLQGATIGLDAATGDRQP